MSTDLEPASVSPVAPFGEMSESDARYVRAARAENTRRAYQSDWADFTVWCTNEGVVSLPAAPGTVTAYMAALIDRGRKISTVARRLTSIRSAHFAAGVPSPTGDPLVKYVWAGIRREHRQIPEKAPPLMPPALWDVLDALPDSSMGERDRALLLVGFVGALRRSELASARIEHLADHPRGRVLSIPVSKTDQYGEGQLVVLPQANRPERCPVAVLDRWLDRLDGTGPLFPMIHRSGCIQPESLSGDSVNDVVQRSCDRALGKGHGHSAHSLRAGFVTYAAARGLTDRAIANQTRHQSLASVAGYIRHETVWIDNAAAMLDF